ncbi:MAG: hypothetical protein KBA95_12675 [Acidobacteria bacterium]|nr:hypothetical protein [Acidobacteriota bacterium]
MGARHFGVGAETTYGTAVTPTRFFEALSESVQTEPEYEAIEVIRGYSTREMALLRKLVRGDVEILANYHGIGLLYQHLIGSVTTTTGSVNTHTFPASTGIPAADRIGLGLTGEFRRDGSLVWTYAGMKITGLSHSFGTDQSSRMSMTFLASTETTGTSSTTATYSTLAPMKPSHVSVNMSGSNVSATSATITIDNPLDEPFGLGSTAMIAEPDRSGVLKVTGSAELLFTTWTQYNYFSAGSDVDIYVIATDTTYSVRYNFDKSRITRMTPHMSGRERLKCTVDWEAFYNSDATENCQIVLVNSDSTA